MGLFKKLFGEDLSKLNEYECYIKAREGNWDYHTGSHLNPARALKYLNQAIKLNPRKTEAYWARGLAYQKLNNFDLAIENFNQAINLEPDDEHYRCRGTCYQQFKQYDKALEDFTTAININPTNPVLYIFRAGLYSLLRQFELAVLDYNFLIDNEPGNFDNYVCRGYLYYELCEYQKAIEDYDKAIELQPDIPIIHQYRDMVISKIKG